MAIGDILGTITPSSGAVGFFIQLFLGTAFVCALALGVFYYTRNKKKWFLKCEIKMARSDGNIVMSEWGKATLDQKRGVVYIKRPKKKPVALKPFDIKRFLQGKDTLTVVQLGLEEYRPVLPESFIELVDDDTGEEAALMKMRIDTTESKAWKESFEREAKVAYSIQSILAQYAAYVGVGIILLMNFIGFAILWSKVG